MLRRTSSRPLSARTGGRTSPSSAAKSCAVASPPYAAMSRLITVSGGPTTWHSGESSQATIDRSPARRAPFPRDPEPGDGHDVVVVHDRRRPLVPRSSSRVRAAPDSAGVVPPHDVSVIPRSSHAGASCRPGSRVHHPGRPADPGDPACPEVGQVLDHFSSSSRCRRTTRPAAVVRRARRSRRRQPQLAHRGDPRIVQARIEISTPSTRRSALHRRWTCASSSRSATNCRASPKPRPASSAWMPAMRLRRNTSTVKRRRRTQHAPGRTRSPRRRAGPAPGRSRGSRARGRCRRCARAGRRRRRVGRSGRTRRRSGTHPARRAMSAIVAARTASPCPQRKPSSKIAGYAPAHDAEACPRVRRS